MVQRLGKRFSVSTWSLHRTLGYLYAHSPETPNITEGKPIWGTGSATLLEIPQKVAELGIHTLEISHFHFPTKDKSYLNELRSALKLDNVELLTLLIEFGDITHPEYHQRDLNWITTWVDIASELGAKRARVIAGKSQPTTEALNLSLKGLTQLAQQNEVRIAIENWFDLLPKPEQVHWLLDKLEGTVGLNGDFGNWEGETKYADLASIFSRAETCHAKAAFSDTGEIDLEDYVHCLDISKKTGFDGPYTLIYDGPNPDEFAGLAQEREIVRPYLGV